MSERYSKNDALLYGEAREKRPENDGVIYPLPSEGVRVVRTTIRQKIDAARLRIEPLPTPKRPLTANEKCQIVEAIKEDGTWTVATLASKLACSARWVQARLKDLERGGMTIPRIGTEYRIPVRVVDRLIGQMLDSPPTRS